MAVSSIPDPYKALGLTPEATAAEIRSAYKKLMLKCHPDKVHDESQKEEKAQQYQKVMEAYELLSDPKKKRRYDLDMQRHGSTESRPTNGATTTDAVPKTEARNTSEEAKKEKSRERQRHESSRQAKREYESEEHVRQRDVPREKETQREKEASREREMSKEREVPHERENPKDKDAPREAPNRGSDIPRETHPREKESSRDRDRDRSHKEHKEYRDAREYKEYHKEYRESKEYKDAREHREHKHSRESSKENERKHNARPETSPPPSTEFSHQKKYEEERRLEQDKLKKVREAMFASDPMPAPHSVPHTVPHAVPHGGSYHPERADSQERIRRREAERIERERLERDNYYNYTMEQKLKKNREARGGGRAPDAEELDGLNFDDIHPRPTESRRGSTQKRETSPKDSPASSRERKSSHSPSHRGGSNSPVRGEQPHSSSRPMPMPVRTPYGSAPPPAAGSTFAPFSSSTSPRRRHSVSSQDPMKATRLYPREDSGYSSPNHPGTPMGLDGRIPPLMRSSTESSERGSGWRKVTLEVLVPDDDPNAPVNVANAYAAAHGGYAVPMPGQIHRRKTTSHHPMESANLTSSPPLHSADFRKAAGSSSASNAYYYPPTAGYYTSPTHAPHHFSHSSGSSSVHPQQSPSRSHSSRHSSSHGSPKVAQEGFVSMDGVRSPSMSSASTVHPAAGYHPGHSYSRGDYFAPPVTLPRGHTI